MTFAPFVNPEKPQVFSAPAASFIRKAAIVCTSDTAAAEPCHLWTRQRSMTHSRISLFLLYFLTIPRPANEARQRPRQASRGDRRWPDPVAHVRGTAPPRFRFGPDSHNFATVFEGVSARSARNEPVPRRRSERSRTENHGRRLPNCWANAGAFSLLTLNSKLAQY